MQMIINLFFQDVKLALKAVTVSKMEEKKKKDKVKDLHQLFSSIEKTGKNNPQEAGTKDHNKVPEILNKNTRFPTFR